MIRVLVVEDYKRWRHKICELLHEHPELEVIVICEVSDGLEAVEKARELRPDLILLDIGIPKLNGIEAARRVRQLSPKSRIVFLSQHNDLDVVRAALSTGALAYVHKADAQSELLPAVDAVLHDKEFVSSSLRGYTFTDVAAAKAARVNEFETSDHGI